MGAGGASVQLSMRNLPRDRHHNTIESLNIMLREISKNRALYLIDEAVFKLLYVGLRNISKKWTMRISERSSAMKQFAISLEGRVPMSGPSTNTFTQAS